MLNPVPTAHHILAYAQTLNGGGVERALLRLASSWSEMGRRVTLLIGDASGPLAAELPEGVDLRILGDPSIGAMRALVGRLHDKDAPEAVVLGFEPSDPLQYGRVLATGDRVTWMVEHKDADEGQRACRLCNSGLLAARSETL